VLSTIIFLIIILLSFGIGAKLLRLAGLFRTDKPQRGRSPFTLVEEFVFAVPLGLGVLSYLILALGLLKLFYLWAFCGLLAVLLIIGWKDCARFLNKLGSELNRIFRKRFDYSSIAFGLWFAAMGGLGFFGALVPASGFDWDGLAYHLAVPKIYLSHHGIMPLPWMSHSNFPFALEMLYTLGLALHGQALARLFHFGCGVLLCIAIGCWANAAFGKGVGRLAAAIFASVPLVCWEATVAYNELALALFCTLSIWAWWKKNEDSKTGWTILSGIFAGLALATKMLAGFLVIFFAAATVWMALLLLWQKMKSKTQPTYSLPNLFLMLAVWLVPAMVVAAPWYVKSYLSTGNPVYPFFYGFFDGRYWSAELANQYSQSQAAFGMGHGIQWLLALPWTLTMYGHKFLDRPGQLIFYNMVIAVLGPLFLMSLPLMLWGMRKNPLVRFLLAYCGAALIAWFFLSAQTIRYILPVVPALAIAAAAALIWIQRRKDWFASLVSASIWCELSLGLAACMLLVVPNLLVAWGMEPQDDYLTRTLNIYPICKQVNTTLPPQAKLMLLGDTRGFYLNREYIWGLGHHNLISPSETTSAQSLDKALTGLEVTHILLPQDLLQAFKSSQVPMDKSLQELITQGRLREVLSDNQKHGFAVYALADL